MLDASRARTLNAPIPPQKQYRGLGGWLAVVGFGLMLSPVIIAAMAYQTALLFSDGTVHLLSDPSGGVHLPGYLPALRFELLVQTLGCLTSVYVLCLYFLKSRLFPRWYIGLQVGWLIFCFVDYAVGNALAARAGDLKEVFNQKLNTMPSEVFRGVLYGLLWVLYILKSKRVRSTFVE